MNLVVVVVHSLGELDESAADCKIWISLSSVISAKRIRTFALFVVNHQCKMPDRRSVGTIKGINNGGMSIFVLDVPLGSEVSDGPVDGMIVQQPTHGKILARKRKWLRVATLWKILVKSKLVAEY